MTDDENKSWFGSWIAGSESWLRDHRVLARAFVGYVFVIFVGFIVMQHFDRRRPAEFVALKMLQPNHRLVAEDIAEAGFWHRFLVPSMTTLDDFYGRYVKDCVIKDDPIGLDQTAGGLQLATTPNSLAWLELAELPLADIVSLDVGDEIQVCNVNGDEACDKTQKVAAIACPDKAMSAACSAGVIMSDAQRVLLAQARDKGDSAPSSSPAPAPGRTTADEPEKKVPAKHAKSDGRPRSATAVPEASPPASSADTASDATPAVHVIVHHTTPVSCSPSPAPVHPRLSMSGRR